MDLIASAVAKVSLHDPLKENEVGVVPAVLVIGAGIAGIQSSLDIAHSGFEVYLVEKSPSLGGHAAQMDRTFPDLQETATFLSSKTDELKNHPMIHFLTQSEVIEVEGFIGNFKVKIRHLPRYVNAEKCTCCKKCEDVCPVSVPDQFNRGLANRRAIYLSSPRAVPYLHLIDSENCLFFKNGTCEKCREVCPEGAIQFEEVGVEFQVDVGTIIVATGFDPFDPKLKPELGYGRYHNVMTALELERLISKTGPTHGKVTINGKEPNNVVFIQCVGSRDKTVNNEYCSRVCCTYTAKQASLIKDSLPNARITVCYIDVRTFGKDAKSSTNRLRKRGLFIERGPLRNLSEGWEIDR